MYARIGYTATASYFHWIVAFPLIGTVGTVLKAQQAPKEEKGEWMWRHKSLGLLTGMVVVPRVAYRLLSRDSYHVQNLLGNSSTENFLGKITHYMLYGFMTIMPATGVAMGYYGGKGLPFFATTFPGVVATDDETKKRNGQIAKQSFNIHKQLGVYGKYLIPVHVGASFLHYFRGQVIYARINPFRPPRG